MATDDDLIRHILTTTKTIALVGASNKPDRPSYEVIDVLLQHGYQVVPVNPGLAGQHIHGQTVVARLEDITTPIDMVDVFRRSEDVEPIAAAAIAIGAKTLWMQLGVINEAAATTARAAGLNVVMNHCPAIELRRLEIPQRGQSMMR